jgi:hypothetical protein
MTLTELQALSPDELRVKVAELCGINPYRWTFCYQHEEGSDQSSHYESLEQAEKYWREIYGGPEYAGEITRVVQTPNWPESLDSCREFEDAMNFSTRHLYVVNLQKVMSVTLTPPNLVHHSACVFATPLQKCQAYILTKQSQ